MFKRKRPEVPGLNTTSTADISFMLLIFFLVTSSMDTTKGLPRQMPQPENQTEQIEVAVKERNVLALVLDADNHITCNGEPLTDSDELVQRVAEFVDNANDDPTLPEKSERELHLLGLTRVSDRHTIIIDASRDASYSAYFDMQNAIVRGYQQLRNRLAQRHFHCDYSACTAEQRDVIALVYPQRISENIPTAGQEEGGEP